MFSKEVQASWKSGHFLCTAQLLEACGGAGRGCSQIGEHALQSVGLGRNLSPSEESTARRRACT